MRKTDLLDLLKQAPIIASVQASPGSPLATPEMLLKLAEASLSQGAKVLRLEGVESIRLIKSQFEVPVIGLIKRIYDISEVYITPTSQEVEELLALGVEVIALDGTDRTRPGGEELADLLAQIHAGGALAMADCDSYESAEMCSTLGFNIISTTLAGYTGTKPPTPGPDLELLREIARSLPTPVLAEGRFQEPWQADSALRMGAAGVVIGGAINDPVKQTARFLQGARSGQRRVGAVDLGGTWLRFGVFGPGLEMESSDRIPLPSDHADRLAWIQEKALEAEITEIGISAGGVIDPALNQVIDAKGFIPDYLGQSFDIPGLKITALNDGLATAWGHACHPLYAGLRTATLAFGTGVGAGFTVDHDLQIGPRGDYPRLNDLPLIGGATVESVLGGLALTADPDRTQQAQALAAARAVIHLVRSVVMPDRIIICGGVGLSSWMIVGLAEEAVDISDFGPDAGLFGAAALALFPPRSLAK